MVEIIYTVSTDDMKEHKPYTHSKDLELRFAWVNLRDKKRKTPLPGDLWKYKIIKVLLLLFFDDESVMTHLTNLFWMFKSSGKISSMNWKEIIQKHIRTNLEIGLDQIYSKAYYSTLTVPIQIISTRSVAFRALVEKIRNLQTCMDSVKWMPWNHYGYRFPF